MEDDDVAQKAVKMFLNTNRFPELQICGPHTKPHGVRGFSKHYHMWFDPKLGHVICAMCQIPCAFFEFTSTLNKPWVRILPPQE